MVVFSIFTGFILIDFSLFSLGAYIFSIIVNMILFLIAFLYCFLENWKRILMICISIAFYLIMYNWIYGVNYDYASDKEFISFIIYIGACITSMVFPNK